MPEYRINPNFELQEPRAADCFAHFNPDTPEQRNAVIDEMARKWRAEGINQMRATVTGPDIEGDNTGYPEGLWLEGWKDPYVRMLDFGASEYPGGAIWPPLTASAGEAGTATTVKQGVVHEHATGAAGDAQKETDNGQ